LWLSVALVSVCASTANADASANAKADASANAKTSSAKKRTAHAKLSAKPVATKRHSFARTLGVGTAGVLTAFLAHEAGHVGANLAMGNVPRFEGFLVWDFVPFFAIAPCIECNDEGCFDRYGKKFSPGRRGKYAIVTAGYQMQHLTDEIILSHSPRLREEYAPFRKGMLLFNIFLSTFYAAGAWTGLQDPHGDLEGAAQLSGIDQTLLSIALVTPAAIDTFRYFVPNSSRWSAWAGRAAKGGFVGLNFAF
jgi:hypothetical protein